MQHDMRAVMPAEIDEGIVDDTSDMPAKANRLTLESLRAEGFTHAGAFMARAWAASLETESRYRGVGALILMPIPVRDYDVDSDAQMRMFVTSANKLNRSFKVVTEKEYTAKWSDDSYIPSPKEYYETWQRQKSLNDEWYEGLLTEVPEEHKIDLPESFLKIPARDGIDFIWDHAEETAIAKAKQLGYSMSGATLFVTKAPCTRCAQDIIDAGIKRVIVHERGHNSKKNQAGLTGVWKDEAAEGERMMLDAGIQYDIWPDDLPMDPKVKNAGELRKGKVFMIGADGLLPDYDHPTYTLGEDTNHLEA